MSLGGGRQVPGPEHSSQALASNPVLTSPVESVRDPWLPGLLYFSGDLLVGTAIGAFLALVHYFLAPAGWGVVGELVVGMLASLVVQLAICMFFGAVLGSMEVMVPGMFACLVIVLMPFLGRLGLRAEILLGAAAGCGIFAGFAVWNEKLRGREIKPIAPQGMVAFPARSEGWPTPGWFYDLLEGAGSRRRARAQKDLYRHMTGLTLFAAAGTGLNFRHFPADKHIVAIDISGQMLVRAKARAARYAGTLELREADVQKLPFPDGSFDTVATASTFCSVPDPVKGLHELFRVLKPGGRLLMFEHVRSRYRLLAWELDVLNFFVRHIGPEINRDTVAHAQRAGFAVDHIVCAYLDVFLAVEAHKPPASNAGEAVRL